jgi:CubicO group peptidase (beta-lactamase class C family)
MAPLQNGGRHDVDRREAAAITAASTLAAGWAGPVAAAPMAITDPAAVGLKPDAMAALSAAMKGLVDRGKRAGVVYGVIRGGKVVALEAFGHCCVEKSLPMRTDSLFRIYSQSRAVTAVAMLTLVEDGTLGLDDPVAKYIPEIANMRVISEIRGDRVVATVPQSPAMTVRHLFNYTAGLGYAFHWPKGVGMDPRGILIQGWTIEQGVRELTRFPLLFQPGAKWFYGFHSDVLGRVAEVAAGQPFNRILRDRLTSRIGMVDTDFWTRDGEADRLAEVYGPGSDGTGLINRTAEALPLSTFTTPGTMFSAGGGLVCSTMDYLRFMQMLLNGGELDGVRVLRPETVKAMGTNALTEAQGGEVGWYEYSHGDLNRGYGWGLAIGVRLPGRLHTVPGSDGDLTWGGLANTVYFLDPKENLGAVAMSQYLGPDQSELGYILRTGVHAALGV